MTNLLELSGLGGICAALNIYETASDEPGLLIAVASLGEIGVLRPELAKRGGSISAVQGVGTGIAKAEAVTPAIAEALERYSMGFFRNEQFVLETGANLAPAALDLSSIPHCSARELAHAKCPLVMPDKTKPIRWVRGVSLIDGRLCYLPAIMVYSQVGYATPAEKFWLPISTGCAAHVSYKQALLGALYEVIERDALTVMWLQHMPLPEIDVDIVPPELAPYWDLYMKASSDVEYRFFDATGDLGVPTVYGLQIARHNNAAATLVSCSTGISGTQALAKLMKDMTAYKRAFRKTKAIPDSWDDFSDLLDGATFMARPQQAGAFDFLTKGGARTYLSRMPAYGTPENALNRLYAALTKNRLEAYVADLSTDEALRAGMSVLRVIVPGLQPLSFRYRARYLGHERLYKLPAALGYPVSAEEDLNPWPQPFA